MANLNEKEQISLMNTGGFVEDGGEAKASVIVLGGLAIVGLGLFFGIKGVKTGRRSEGVVDRFLSRKK